MSYGYSVTRRWYSRPSSARSATPAERQNGSPDGRDYPSLIETASETCVDIVVLASPQHETASLDRRAVANPAPRLVGRDETGLQLAGPGLGVVAATVSIAYS